MSCLREQINVDFFRNAYRSLHPDVHSAAAGEDKQPTNVAGPAEAETETLVPSTHVIKANLHIDGIQSFGKWQILTSSRALRDLRRARREDAKKFEIIVKKIR